ncbi:DUF1294 domain-containing protein [Bacillus mangrovi]|uniref:DUF1294 domain-containing protein n=1 Tax=Metabacillus mangrovi TaxID=1491830 RepID=A0A7X2S454_9BACI|nr:DUF1294 domain-containing protein [Metabacillus mangrovi]MTH52898.1 DUF1294 domain-containing protein [Metabacillus mangrovi]
MGAVFIYYAVMGIAGFSVMAADKKRAQKSQWRISENTLWLIALAGGVFGSWIGMYTVRHKTKHAAFRIGMPLLGAAHVLFTAYFAGLIG